MAADATDHGLDHAYNRLIATRPTAVNLRWALDRVKNALIDTSPSARASEALNLAHHVAEEDVGINKAIGEHGLSLSKTLPPESQMVNQFASSPIAMRDGLPLWTGGQPRHRCITPMPQGSPSTYGWMRPVRATKGL